MRHRKAGRKLNRSWEHRKAMFKNMAGSLVVHESIRTTEARAKELRKVMDRLVTLALRNDVHARRQAYKILAKHSLVKRLFDEIGPRFAGVAGGYTRVVKLGLPRLGDCASMAVIEFTRKAGEKAVQKDKPKKEAKAGSEKKSVKTKAKSEKEPEGTEVKKEVTATESEQAAAADAPVQEQESVRPAQEEPQAAEESSTRDSSPDDVEAEDSREEDADSASDPGEEKK